MKPEKRLPFVRRNQEIEKKSLEELDMVLPGSKKQKKSASAGKTAAKTVGKGSRVGVAKASGKTTAEGKTRTAGETAAKSKTQTAKSGAGRKDR